MAKSLERPEVGSEEKEHLTAEAKKGDRKAQEAIYRDFAPRLIALAREYKIKPEDAEEVISKCFPEAFEIQPSRSYDEFFRSVSRMVRNRIFDRMRGNGVRGRNAADIARLDDRPEVEDPETQLLRAQDKEFVNELLARMEPQQAALLCLREFDGLSYKEMSDELGISETEAMTQYRAARKQFEELAHAEKGKFEA